MALCRGHMRYTRVVYPDINPSALVEQLVHQPATLRRITDVQRFAGRRQSLAAQHFGSAGAGLAVNFGNDSVRASLPEAPGHPKPQPPPRSGDYHRFAGENHLTHQRVPPGSPEPSDSPKPSTL